VSASHKADHDPFLWDDIEVELCSAAREAYSYPVNWRDVNEDGVLEDEPAIP